MEKQCHVKLLTAIVKYIALSVYIACSFIFAFNLFLTWDIFNFWRFCFLPVEKRFHVKLLTEQKKKLQVILFMFT